ncbi:NIC-domain-containing protein [Acephala macrosclerotiorum]|nr:NIC-domain-containing protein [Acephala macrosclerotiorum]
MSNLFGNLNNTNKSDYGGLFSSTSKPATTSAAGGFGGLGLGSSTSQSQAPSTGFGLGGLGGLGLGGGGTSQAPGTSSTFGGFGQTTTAGAGGLGGTATSNAPPGGSVFGPGGMIPSSQAPASFNGSISTSQPVQNGQNTAYFDAILERSRKRAHAESIADDLPQIQLGLGDLRQRIKRVGTGAQGQAADSRAHYLLAASGVNPGDAIRDLNQFTAANARAERPVLQEPQDVDVETYLTNLQTQTTLSMISDGLARSVRDFDAFLEDNVEMEWDAQRRRIYTHFGIRPKETTAAGGKGSFAASVGESNGAFGRSRRSKAANLTGSRMNGSPGGSTFGRSTLQKSVIGAAGPVGAGHQPLFADVEKKMEASGVTVTGPHDRFQRDKESNYAGKVQNLNIARLQKRPYPVCAEFADVVNLSPDQHGADLIKAYKALMEIVGEDPEAKEWSEERTARERKFAADYLGDNPVTTLSMKKRILRGGVRCLEKLAFEKMEDAVARNPRDANVGGIPNVINKVKGYVRLQAGKKNLGGDNTDLQMLGDDYVWALVYFLLRTGHVAEALEYVEQNQVAFRAIDRNFQGYIRAYSQSDDRRLDEVLQSRINSEYNQRLRIAPENSIDPYRMACYKIIGRCDLRQRFLEGIEQSFEDWAWVQLVLAREINRVDAMASEIFGLSEAQDTMREIGNRYFTKGSVEGNSFGVYVFLQLAYGMFEDCVSYLYTYNYVDGVHLAIALDFYGLLRVADPNSGSEDLLSLTTRGQPQISFGTMLGLYTRDFRAAAVSAAVDYLTLICLNKDLPGQGGTNQMMLCHEALRELVLESREFALLLGDMRNDGQRIRGVIEDRMRLIGLDESGDFMRTITLQAASIADDNGRVTDAVLLYHLAGEYDSVITTINRALSEAIAIPIGQDPLRIEPLKPRAGVNPHEPQQGTESSLTSIDDPVQLADVMRKMYEVQQMFSSRVKTSNWDANSALLNMTVAKHQVERADFAAALDEIRKLAILPLEANGNPSLIRDCATKFSSLSQSVAQNVPNLLMWAIHCAESQRRNLMNSQFGGNEGTRLAMIEELKQMNMDLMTYTSQLRYRFPASIHEALARAQSE